MIAFLTLVIYLSLIVAFIALGWLMWHGLTPSPRVDSLRHGTAAQTLRRGEAPTGLRCACRIFDQDAVAA